MNPDEQAPCSSGSDLDGKQEAEKTQGKKSRQNEWLESNGLQTATGTRPKQRSPGNISVNGVCPSDHSKLNNNRDASICDPYSVSYNVDSKTNLDKCIGSKMDCSDRKAEGFNKARCSWSLENVKAQSSYHQQVSCEDNNEQPNIKINNTESDLGNGSPLPECSYNVNNLESQFFSRNCTQGKELTKCSDNSEGRNDFNINVPSTSNMNGGSPSLVKSPDGPRVSRKRTAKGKEKRLQLPQEDDSSSDTGNDDYSMGSDDSCIYTYRGGEHLADLPSSFVSLDMGLSGDHLPTPPLFGPRQEPLHEDREERDSGASSPDMDFLEMDFDPGPSCEADSNEESSLNLDLVPPLNQQDKNSRPRSSDLIDELGERDDQARNCEVSSTKAADTAKPSDQYPNVNNIDLPGGSGLNCVGLGFSNEPSTSRASFPGPSTSGVQEAVKEPSECCKTPPEKVEKKAREECRPYGTLIAHTTLTGETIYVRRTSLSWPPREIQGHHSSSGDLVSPGETCEADLPESLSWSCVGGAICEQAGILEASRVNLSSALFHCTMAKRLLVDKQSANFLHEQDTSNVDGAGAGGSGEPPAVSKNMVWSEQEACSRQVTQIGTSACGATAVINALLGLQPTVDVERVTSSVCTRQRCSSAPLCRYLVSRSVAGCGVRALAAGLRAGSAGAVSSRFFATWPERVLPLSHWLAYWIGLGAVPIATLNLQAGVADPSRIPDSWHHQMIFGVGPRGIYMANPVECVEEGALWHQLCSDSVLLIKRKDVLSRWTRDCDLSPLKSVPGEERWSTLNVLGQVVNIIRESKNSGNNGQTRTTHIRIPACYRAGITIAVLTGSEAHKRLLLEPELPLLYKEDD